MKTPVAFSKNEVNEVLPTPTKKRIVPVAEFVATPSIINFSVKDKFPQSREIYALGIRGGIYSNVVLTNATKFTRTSGSSNIMVDVRTDADGIGKRVISITDGIVGQTAMILATYVDDTMGTLTDTIKVVVVP
jgi:hypothetical protein